MSDAEIEARLTNLETEVARLKAQIQNSDQTPWQEEILGSFADDPAHDEAMRLGREYRKSLRAKIDHAAEQLDRGEGIDGETVIAQLRNKLHSAHEL